MRNIALLIKKDFIGAISGYGSSIITFLIFFAMAAINLSFIPMAINMIIYMLVVTLFQTEENDLVCNVRAILPVRSSQLVVARYLYLYLLILVSAALLAVVAMVGDAVTGTARDWTSPLAVGTILGLFMASLMMPLMYRFGVLKMRIIVMVIYCFVIAGSFAVPSITNELGNPPAMITIYLVAALCIFLLSLLSMAVSMGIMKNK